MAKGLSRQQKAANTRKANAKKKHKIVEGLEEAIDRIPDGPWVVIEVSLAAKLDQSIKNLEERIAGYIARVDRILA